MGKSFQIIFSKSLGLSQNTKQGVSAVSRNALFFRKCSYACCACYSSKSQSGSGTGGQAHLFPLHGRERMEYSGHTANFKTHRQSYKIMIADLKSCLSIMKTSRQNYQRASLPKCSLMHQKAEQRDFRHAVLSKPYKPVLCAATLSPPLFNKLFSNISRNYIRKFKHGRRFDYKSYSEYNILYNCWYYLNYPPLVKENRKRKQKI